ncbi:MAG: 30S ribosomal protein S18, partial [Candidatus Nealsonbacteria bacterium]|nr:30S ribosomal protein S18 [Candidatus Nealsonbacteria bacterium]
MNCFFCQKNIQGADYKDVKTLKRFISGLGKIRPRKRTGTCSSHQRKLAKAIKRARQLGLVP